MTRVDDRGRWRCHDEAWRDPAQVVAQWEEASTVDAETLRHVVRGPWWRLLGELGIVLLVSREYEHVLLGLSAQRPRATYLALPHPSGIAVDRERSTVALAATRNPNQVLRLATAEAGRRRPLVPVSSSFYPGRLYLHDLAYVGRRLYGNAVGADAVVLLGDDGRWEPAWWPRSVERSGEPTFERNHLQLNSIAAGASLRDSFFTASAEAPGRRRPGDLDFPVDGRGVLFSGRTREPVACGLTRPHSARFHGGRVWVDNSGYGEVGVVDGGGFEAVARLPGWTRGLCFAGDVAFVGVSRVIPRFRAYAPGLEVDASRCGVFAVDTGSGRVLASIEWPAGNQIFAVDWLAVDRADGLPFPVDGAGRDAARKLFYDYGTGGTTGG